MTRTENFKLFPRTFQRISGLVDFPLGQVQLAQRPLRFRTAEGIGVFAAQTRAFREQTPGCYPIFFSGK